jgi:O-antigen/teichoic acid export membrane protein
LKLDKTAMTEMFSFGKWIFLSTALTFFAMQSDRLILGKVLGLNLLGVYGIAVTLADLPKQVTMAVGGKIIFPMFTKFVDLPRREFCRKIRQGRWPILLATAPLLAIMISFGDVLITTLYDSRYQAAAWMIPLLALGVWPIILMTTVDGALFALGNAKINTWSYFASFVALITGIWVGGYFYGVVGAVAAVPLSNVPLYGVIAYGVHKEGLSNFDQDGYATALMLICATVLIWSRYMLGFPLPGLPG